MIGIPPLQREKRSVPGFHNIGFKPIALNLKGLCRLPTEHFLNQRVFPRQTQKIFGLQAAKSLQIQGNRIRPPNPEESSEAQGQ